MTHAMFVDQLRYDLRLAVRRLAGRRAYTLAVVTVLGLGTGATTAVFSAIDAALFRPLPFRDPEGLVLLRGVRIPSAGAPGATGMMSGTGPRALNIDDILAMQPMFGDVAAYAAGGLNLEDPDRPLRVRVGVVTPGLLATLGAAPARGRAFSADEGRPGNVAVAILSDRLWRAQFGDRVSLDTTIMLNGTAYQVIGVMPAGFGFPSGTDLWIPLTVPVSRATFEPFEGILRVSVVARLGKGVSATAADKALRARWEEIFSATDAYPELAAEIRKRGAATPLQRELAGDRTTLFVILLAATVLLLLVACANVMNLQLAHAAPRRPEMAVREVLGATPSRLVRQLLTESVVLALGGVLLGLAMAPATLQVMAALMPEALAGVSPAAIDLRVLAFAAALTLVTAIAFGLWPALHLARGSTWGGIGSGGTPGLTAGHAGRTRTGLIVTELALATVLLIGAGLMVRSLDRLLRSDLGMRVDGVGTLEVAFPWTRGNPADIPRKRDAILAQIRAIPGVERAAVVRDLPLTPGSGGIPVIADGQPSIAAEEERVTRPLYASEGYFHTMGVPLRGRDFTSADDALPSQVAIINETMARRFWPDQDPIGRTFRYSVSPNAWPITVIGVVGDIREGGLEVEPAPYMYSPVIRRSYASWVFVAHSRMPRSDLLAAMVRAVHAADPAQAVYNVQLLEDVVDASLAPRRASTVLISTFATLALVLAAFGVYAAVGYSVAQRARELGIRAALGATGHDLAALISREMAWVIPAGVGIGLFAAWALAQTIAGQLYGIDAHDPVTFVFVPLVLAIPAAAAAFFPARRASRVNPVDVIRSPG